MAVWGEPALVTARDHRGNRIEPFRQTRYHGSPREWEMPNRNCTRDRVWCADLRRDRSDGGWTLHILVRGGDPSGQPRHHSYSVPQQPCCFRPGMVWEEIVREPRGGALIGIVFHQETTGENNFRSYQRRLHLLRVPSEDGGVPVPVLDVPLSGVVEQPVCRSAEEQRARGADCMDSFYLSTLFTLVPSVAPVEPPNLILVATAWTSPGRRSRAGGPVLRDPVERVGDHAPDPACTFTRSYYFDEASGRYIADGPLPDCRDFLEP
ncbi:MAG: hypothetical protein M3177_01165 [Pseudomonadota bacterium]|nr:hypothetical protein [Pseudomonadota bacterium]